MIKRRMKNIAVAMTAIVAVTSIAKMDVEANNNVKMQIMEEALESSRRTVGTIESLGIDLDKVAGLRQSAEFCDISYEDLAGQIGINLNGSSNERKAVAANSERYDGGINYQPLFLKQAMVISDAVDRSIRRGMSSRTLTVDDEAQYMFISHYIDGNGGLSMYLTEYGYQNQYMADWVTDMDRKVYDNLRSALNANDELNAFSDTVQLVNDGVEAVTAFKDEASLAEWFWTEIAEECVKSGLSSSEEVEIDFNELIGEAEATLEVSRSMSDFQTQFLPQVANKYDYLEEAAVEILMTIIIGLVLTASPVSILVDLAVIVVIGLPRLAGDLYLTVSQLYLELSRNARVAERVCDYMEYMGYW